MLSDQNPDEHPLADTQRLINTLERCFSDLMRKQEEQSDKFHETLEALKPKPPATDTKTAFWNAYKTVADEHDREFQQKYSSDLDTALIFAGLFSAVDSAFIIQIQQEIHLQNTPILVLIAQNLLYVSLFSTLLAALLAVLGKQWLMYYLAAGERGTIEARGLERQRKFDGLQRWKFDAVMQTFPLLLQIGLFLFSAALSIYLRTIHKSLAIVVLSFTSLGFISYIGLFISAVAAPDSPFQTPLAPLVRRLIPTTLLMVSKRFASRILAEVFQTIRHGYYIVRGIRGARNILPFRANQSPGNPVKPEPAVLFDVPVPKPSAAVPAVCWLIETSTDPRMIALAAEMAITLQWPSGMDVRPLLSKLRDGILSCFEFFTHGRQKRFVLTSIRHGMTIHAIHLGRAYCTLRVHIPRGHLASPYWRFETGLILPVGGRPGDPELENLLKILSGSPDLHFASDTATKWGLHVSCRYAIRQTASLDLLALEKFLEQFASAIPALDKTSFADYLFCVLAFLSCVNSRGVVCMDKSPVQGELFQHLFYALELNLRTHQISMATAANIIDITGQILAKSKHVIKSEGDVWDFQFHDLRHRVIFQFCNSLPEWDGWINVVLATGSLTGWHDYGHPLVARAPNRQQIPNPRDGGWVYKALESIAEITVRQEDHWDSGTTKGVAGLLEALFYYDVPPEKEHIPLLLRALTIPGDVSHNAAVLLVQDNVITWFQDEKLQPILKDASVWSSLMRLALDLEASGLTRDCIRVGHTLASLPFWKSEIVGELCSWITIYFRLDSFGRGRGISAMYSSILGEICQTPYDFVNSTERAFGLSYQVLSKVWRDFDFTTWGDILKSIPWLRCTSSVLIYTHFRIPDEEEFYSQNYMEITSDFETAFSDPLREALLQAATAVGNMPAENSNGEFDSCEGKNVVEKITKLLKEMENKTPKHTDPEKTDIFHWRSLRKQMDQEIDKLETELKNMSAALVTSE